MRCNVCFVIFVFFPIICLYRLFAEELVVYPNSDVLVTIILLCFVCTLAKSRKQHIEKSEKNAYAYDMRQQIVYKKLYHIFKMMVPSHVIVPMLVSPGGVIADHIDCASILFIMIEDIDVHVSKLTPDALLLFLNETFKEWDSVCARHGVSKIETIGEEYVAAVGVVPDDIKKSTSKGHGCILVSLINVASEILSLESSDCHFKMGMHTGPIVAGVIGRKLPRFRLFGDTINTAARMMQKGLPGHLQFGEETRRQLPPWAAHFAHLRGQVEMKGKGLVTTYFLYDRHHEGTPGTSATGSMENLSATGSVCRKALEHVEGVASSVGTSLPRSNQWTPRAGADVHVELADLALIPRPSHGSLNGKRRSRPIQAEHSDEAPIGGWSGYWRGLSQASDGAGFDISEEEDENTKDELDELDELDEFGRVARAVAKAHNTQHRGWLRWTSCGLRTSYFTKDMERRFQQWYHEKFILKKFEERIVTHAMLIAGLSVLEAVAFLLRSKSQPANTSHDLDRDDVRRLIAFTVFRSLCLLLMKLWQRAYHSGHVVDTEPDVCQWLLLSTYITVAAMFFFSYDAITSINHAENDETGWLRPNSTDDELRFMMHNHRRGSSVNVLIFVPVYVMITTQMINFRFQQATCFVALTVVLIWITMPPLNGWKEDSFHMPIVNLFFSRQARLLLIGVGGWYAWIAYQAEWTNRSRFKAQVNMEHSNLRIRNILVTLMPPLVVEEVRHHADDLPFLSHHYQRACIAQSDLAGFTRVASDLQPKQVVELISDLFGRFDELTDKFGIYKVETVGDAYIAGQAEAPLTQEHSPCNVLRFAMAMVETTREWAGVRRVQVDSRVGVHFGECVGGIVGTEMQRYHLFGHFMRVVEILESTSPEGRVHISLACHAALAREQDLQPCKVDLAFSAHEVEHLVTSKGEVHEFREVGGQSYLVSRIRHSTECLLSRHDSSPS